MTETASGTREQWVYDHRRYLYFENGRLVAIQRPLKENSCAD
jgi:hypothetical protein